MDEELPILKGILNGVVNYHNARTYFLLFFSVYLISTFKDTKVRPQIAVPTFT